MSEKSPPPPPPPPPPHCYDSALSMARAIREGTVTSRQLVELHIARIERHNGNINAVILVDYDGARRRADQADALVRTWRRANHHPAACHTLGIFHGVPMTIKESNATPGFPITMGDPRLSWFNLTVASSDSSRIVLEQGGAILLGKTNLPWMACDWEANNAVYGRTGNPYDPQCSPGGSSGGAAAALAAGMTPLEIGSDIGGSIRIPAALCGVVGHCPTRGLWPAMGFRVHGPCCGCIDKCIAKVYEYLAWMARDGPMARTVDDVVAMLELVAGDKALGLPRPKSSLQEYRIAVWRSHDICPPGRHVQAAMDQVMDVLQTAGAVVEELQPPVDPMETYTLYLQCLSTFMYPNASKQQTQNARHGRARETYPADNSTRISPFWVMDEAMVHGVPKGSKEACERLSRVWDDHLKQHHYDAVLAPIVPCEAWPTASEPGDTLANAKTLTRKLLVDGEERYYGDGLFWTHLQVLCGLPATGFPVTFTKQTPGGGRLPVGLQAFGAKGNDLIVLDVVNKIMEALGRNQFSPPPGF